MIEQVARREVLRPSQSIRPRPDLYIQVMMVWVLFVLLKGEAWFIFSQKSVSEFFTQMRQLDFGGKAPECDDQSRNSAISAAAELSEYFTPHETVTRELPVSHCKSG